MYHDTYKGLERTLHLGPFTIAAWIVIGLAAALGWGAYELLPAELSSMRLTVALLIAAGPGSLGLAITSADLDLGATVRAMLQWPRRRRALRSAEHPARGLLIREETVS